MCLGWTQENIEGQCVELPITGLNNTLIIIVILLGAALVVSVTINLVAAAKSGKFIGRNKKYPLSEFSATHHRSPTSMGLSNSGFLRD